MSNFSIRPLKIYNSVFLVLLCCNIVFWIALQKVDNVLATNIFLIGLIPVMLTFISYFSFNRIDVSEEKIIIKEFGAIGYKRLEFLIRDIVRLETKRGKLYFGQRRNYFAIHYGSKTERGIFVINEEKYLIKHLDFLFNNLHDNFRIQLDKN